MADEGTYTVSTGVVALIPSARGFGQAVSKEIGADLVGAGKKGGEDYGSGFSGSAKKWGKRAGVALVAGVAAVAGGAALAAKGLYGIGDAFDEVTDTIRVGTGATGDALEALTDSAKAVGSRVPAEFEAIGTTVADLNTRLGLTGPTLETLSSQVLEAGRIFGEEIDVNGLSASFSAFKVEGEDTTAAMDHLFQVSQATGVGINELASNVAKNAPAVQQLGWSFEETAGLVGSLDKAGLNSSRMMAGLSQSLVRLAEDGEEPADAFNRTVGEIEGFLAAGDKAAAIDLAGEVFGTRNATQFIGALESGTLALDDLGSVAGMTEDTILGAGRETMDFSEQWQIFKNKVMVGLEPLAARVFNAFGQGMDWVNTTGIPTIERFADWLGPKLQRPLEWIQTTGSAVFDEIKGSVAAFTAAWTYNDGEVTSSGLPGVMEKVGYYARQAFDYIRTTVIPTAIDLAKWLYENRNTLMLLGAAVLGGLAAFKAFMFVRTVITAIKAARVAMIAFNAVLRANPIGIVVTAIGVLVGALVWLYKNNETTRKIVDAAWAGIKAGIDAVVRWFTDTAWPWMRDAFGKIRDRAVWLKNGAVDAFDKIKGGISTAWDGARSILNRFKDGLDSLRDKAVAVKDGIGRVWSTLGAAFAKPINVVIDTVNRFLENVRKNLNKIPGVEIGGNWGVIPHVPVPAGTTSSASTAGSGRGGRGAVMLADGLWVPGHSPHSRADNIPAMLTANEFVTRQWAALRMKRKHPGALEYINRFGELPRFADGGMVAPGTGGALDKTWSFVTDLWQRGAIWVKDLFERLMPDFDGSWAGMAAKGAISALDLGKVADWLKEKALGSLGGSNAPMTGGQRVNYGGPYGWAPRGIGTGAMRAMLAAIAPEARVTSGYRPGAITASGIRSLHAEDRALDVVSANMRETFMKLLGAVGGSASQLYYSPMGGLQVGYRDAAVHRMHFDHIHWGYNDGGFVKPFVADSGVTLAPGINVLDNRLGKPEPLARMDKPMVVTGTLQIGGDGLARIIDGRIQAADEYSAYRGRAARGA